MDVMRRITIKIVVVLIWSIKIWDTLWFFKFLFIKPSIGRSYKTRFLWFLNSIFILKMWLLKWLWFLRSISIWMFRLSLLSSFIVSVELRNLFFWLFILFSFFYFNMLLITSWRINWFWFICHWVIAFFISTFFLLLFLLFLWIFFRYFNWFLLRWLTLFTILLRYILLHFFLKSSFSVLS